MPNRPNIILCLCDQLRAFEVGCYGCDHIRTPHLDQLAAEGVRFEIAVSNNPVCTPTRCSILSGQYSRTCTGTTTNTNEQWPEPTRTRMPDATLPEVLKAAGYDTQLIGKWHIWDEPLAVGFDHAVYPNIIHRHYGQQYRDDRGDICTVDEFAPDFEMRRLDAFLDERRNGTVPFFLYYNISQPHMPVGKGNTPQRYLDMYDAATVPLRDNVTVSGKLAHDPEWFLIYNDPDYWYRKFKGGPFKDTDVCPEGYTIRDLTADYDALVTICDDQVGHLMSQLRANSLDDNTIVVFMSDHGDNLGSHHMFNKGQLIEESIRVPLIVWQPGSLEPHVNDQQIAQVIDIMPTLLGLAGVDPVDHTQGRDLSPVLRREVEATADNYAVIETPSLQLGLRTPRFTCGMKLDEDRNIVDDRLLLFDNAADPYQRSNLAKADAPPPEADELWAMLRRWHEHTPWMPTC